MKWVNQPRSCVAVRNPLCYHQEAEKCVLLGVKDINDKASSHASNLRGVTRSLLEEHERDAPRTTVLSCLLEVQEKLRYVPEEAIAEVARHTGHSINDVWGVASFYTNFRFAPPPAHIVEVCWGPTCHLLGAMDVLVAIQGKLGLDGEGDVADGSIGLKYNTCLGACSQGPVISVDERIIGGVSVETALATIETTLGSPVE
mgnify:CR=1 FL=1